MSIREINVFFFWLNYCSVTPPPYSPVSLANQIVSTGYTPSLAQFLTSCLDAVGGMFYLFSIFYNRITNTDDNKTAFLTTSGHQRLRQRGRLYWSRLCRSASQLPRKSVYSCFRHVANGKRTRDSKRILLGVQDSEWEDSVAWICNSSNLRNQRLFTKRYPVNKLDHCKLNNGQRSFLKEHR